MSLTTALIANVALDLAAIAPIYLLTRWALRAERSDAIRRIAEPARRPVGAARRRALATAPESA